MLNKLKNLAIYFGIRLITLDYYVVKKIIKKYYSRKTASILDFGCGIGHLSKLFKRKGYLGIDIDPDLIPIAKANNPGYYFQTGDVTTFKSKTKFELVIIIGVLHHLDNNQIKKAIVVVKNVLKKNGKAIIVEAIPPINNYNFIGKTLRNLDQGHYVRGIGGYKKILEKKFKVEDSYEIAGGLVDYGVFIITN